ncbi:ensconsin-like isoform X4 [Dermacentor silvarum]|uniref:ensconsin-like isoform X4 n=1 Tax=Dermacentor silvarum TaxID=543639 RepID=UPI00189BC67C|nr:ensconsin-like isoform X4 [Dermacentor silvarum]
MADDPQLASPKRNTSDSNHITKKSACNTPMAQKSPKQDMYWFAYAADPPAERHRRGLWAQQVDELASPEQELNGATSAQKESPCSPLDTYWFAHAGGDAPSEDGTERRLSPDRSQAGDSESGGGGDSPQHPQLSQLSREERLRLVKERQEEQRARRLQELEHQTQAAQHYREQLEEERRRRIEEMRQRDHERRLQVEERKRLIWEADHERKEAMLKRNIERESKLDARRSTNRMSMSFAFGSSTPRTFDLDLATMSSAGAPVLMSAAPQRKSEERDFESSRKRAASAYNLCQAADADQTDSSPSQGAVPDVAFVSPTIGGWLVGSGVTVDSRRRGPQVRCLVSGPDPGEDPMTRSMTALPSQHSRGRRKTDLMPVIPWNRSAAASASRSRSPATAPSSSSSGVAQRAVSMSRLDMLAQPRRPRLLPASPSTSASAAAPPSMAAKSMLNLSSGSPPSRRGVVDMSQSMVLPGRGGLGNGSGKLRSARSMSQLAIAPRPTRASQLRATNRMAGSAATGKEQQSPSRPRSSMSVASEHSVASSQMSSSVVMRPRPPPRKPRPLSIAGTIPDKALQSRQNLVAEKTAPALVERKKSARSSNGTEGVAGTAPEVPPKPAHLRKPQKPQPPAASAFRKEQRPPAPPARTAKDTPPKERAGSKEKSPLVAKDPSHTVGPAQGVQASLPTAAVAPIVATAAVKGASVAVSGVTEPATAPPDVVASNVIAAADQKQGASPAENNTSEVLAAVAAEQEQKSPGPQEVPITTGPAEQKPATFQIGVTEGPAQQAPQGADPSTEDVPSKPAPRVISEEEARALLAEKRRLAREQAEREAELERQRQEELRRQEEERLRLEEEEQRRAEEEQLRLAEEFRRQEEEKLQRAIEEQQKREAEERERRELEAQQKAEREEQERKAREEAERQRKELEERLKREEAERAERKKRVEEIMSRTRRRGAKDPGSPANKAGSDAQASPERDNSPSVSGRSSPQPLQGKSSDEKGAQQEQSAAPETVPSGGHQQSPQALELAAPKLEGVGEDSGRREQGSLVNVAMPAAGSPEENCVNGREPIVVERADSVADSSNSAGGGSQGDEGSAVVEEPMDQSPPHGMCFSPPSVASEGTTAPLPPCTNGYGSHHTNGGGDIINGVGSEKVADLLGLDSLGPLKPEALNTGSQAVENLRNSGDINSNRIVPTGNPLIGFEEDNRNNSAKTQEMQFTDLLS